MKSLFDNLNSKSNLEIQFLDDFLDGPLVEEGLRDGAPFACFFRALMILWNVD